MGVLNREAGEIRAKIVYWGPSGAGLTSNLLYVYRKLRREHRGELRTRQADGGHSWEYLPVDLGPVRDLQTSVQLCTIPGGENNRARREAILEGVDGIVLVADLRPERHDATLTSLTELRQALASWRQSLDDLVLVIQYNHRDQADENALDALHKRLGLRPTATFEAVASEGTGVLQTLTSLTKLILKRLRQQAATGDERTPTGTSLPTPAPSAEVVATPEAVEATPLESAPVAAEAVETDVLQPDCEREDTLGHVSATPAPQIVLAEDSQEFSAPLAAPPAELADEEPKTFRLANAGPVEMLDGELRIPLRLLEEASGREIALCLKLTIEPS